MNWAILVRVMLVIFFLVYPFIVYFGIRFFPPSFFGLLLSVLLAMRLGVLKKEERLVLLPVLVVFIGYSIATAFLNNASMLLFYPVMVNFGLFITFANSLRQEESLLLRIVRARGATISEYTPGYLYRLTAVWAGFFVLNGLISIWTITLSMEAWTLYNGLLSYGLVGALIGGELLFRHFYKKRKEVALKVCSPHVDIWGQPEPGLTREFPEVLSRLDDFPNYRLRISITPDLDCFDGHFPDNPILAGVTQLHWAVRASCCLYGFDEAPLEVKRLKFKNVVSPPMVLELALSKMSANEVQFEFASPGQAHSEGRLIFDGEITC
jgi:uncharacterized membrane protein/3-hydroxymyristoyl/3-hydroxydecanoyl-(acyl carrier protein) dehydratase